MPDSDQKSLQTPLRRISHFGAARTGTQHFWHQRLTAVADIPLTIAVVAILIGLFGRNHAAVVKILGSPFVAIVMLLFLFTSIYHMWIGMQEIIVDYLHDERVKLLLLMANTFFCFAVGFASAFAIFSMSFGV